MFPVFQVSRNLTDWWLSYWTQHHLELNQTTSVYVLNPSITNLYYANGFITNTNQTDFRLFFIAYGVLCGSNSVFTLIRAFSFAYSCIVAGKYIHNCLIDSLMKVCELFPLENVRLLS
jgi:ATP-binding cassette subfamily C (CFTR/MRP) protein 10